MNNINLGYACINETLTSQNYKFQSMTVKHYKENELLNRIRNNFYTTYKILEWNAENNVHLYRFSSNLVPLATHELNNINWWADKEVLKYCKLIREICETNNIQTSFHPDQFTLLTSFDDKIIQKSYNDLKYHYKLCQLLNCKCILLHIGGSYGNKTKAIERFKYVFNKLPQQIQNVLFFENDDKTYDLETVLEICEDIQRPCVPDWHHSRCLPSERPFNTYVDRILNTWQYTSLKPKCHLSSSKEGDKLVRSHADYITIEDYQQCLKDTEGKFNIMLECKAKELSLLMLKNS